jgi:hypothetical protein
MTTKPEARIRAMKDGPASPPAEDVLAVGAAFTAIQVEGEEWDRVWFGPAATVTDEVQAEVASLKREIIRLFLGRHAQSQHTWGRS